MWKDYLPDKEQLLKIGAKSFIITILFFFFGGNTVEGYLYIIKFFCFFGIIYLSFLAAYARQVIILKSRSKI